MRKNNVKHTLAALLLLLVASVCMVACNPTTESSKNTGSTGSTSNNDNTSKDGWQVVSNVVEKDMYQSLLLGATNIVSELSKSKVDKSNAVTIDGKVGLTLNGSDLWFSIKGKYDQKDPSLIREKAMLSLELYTTEELDATSKQIGIYVYNNELYLCLGTNKVKFSLANSQWTNYFPFNVPDISQNIAKIAGLLPQYIKLTEVNGQYRRNSNKEEYKYNANVNVSQTIVGLCRFLNDEKLFSDREAATTIKEFAADVLNISVNQLERGEVSDSTLQVSFMTSGDQLQDMNASTKIALGKDAKNLIGADEMNVDIKIIDLKITKDYATGTKIAFVNDTKERNSYISYSKAIYALKVPVKRFGENYEVENENYRLCITTRVFQDNRDNNFFFCEYYNEKNDEVERAVYFYKDYIFLYQIKEEEPECICKFEINLSDLATNVVSNTLVPEEEKTNLEVYGLIAYVLKNISLTNKDISFALNNDFYSKVWYNFYDMLKNINSVAPENLYENEEVVDFVHYITETGEIVTIEYNNDSVVTIITDDKKDEKISFIYEMLDNEISLMDVSDQENGEEEIVEE